jgi:hypothetical protein
VQVAPATKALAALTACIRFLICVN